MGALADSDLRGRIEMVRGNGAVPLEFLDSSIQHAATRAQAKWDRFHQQADRAAGGTVETSLEGSEAGESSISDVWVAPFVQTRWSQRQECSNDCYNYYISGYPCGCVATAMAQLMRHHQHPTTGIGALTFSIEIDEVTQDADTRGGDGTGGAYNWSLMMADPDCSITQSEREAIGALCWDAGLSVNMSYTTTGSGANTLNAKTAFINTFDYSNAVKGYNSGNNIGTALNAMVNPNLDAGYPVVLGITGDGGHAIITDGYGYDSSTLYHHLNMGWGGYEDAWYNLPTVDAGSYNFNSVYKAVYNVYATGSGEIISGRVTDSAGTPLAGVSIEAQRSAGGTYTDTTDSNGIYALAKIPSSSSYTITASLAGYDFPPQSVSTGASSDYGIPSGNLWSVDFTDTGDTTPPTIPTDLSLDTMAIGNAELSWTASTDDDVVEGYRVFRNGGSIGTTATTAYTDATPSCCSSYSYTVTAFDPAANESAHSDPVIGTTGPEEQDPDLHVDGVVDLKDVVVMAGYWLDADCGILADLNADEIVDLHDFHLLRLAWTGPDEQAPSIPAGLTVDDVTETTVALSWTAATDNVAVAGYRVFRDGGSVATTSATAYTDSGLTAETVYSYTVSAFDTAVPANESAQSSPLVVTTLASEDPSLIGYWPFDEGTGSTAYDASSNANNGTINGATWTTTAQGGSNALDFDGSNDYVSLGGLDVSGSAMTLAAWIRLDTITGDPRFISKADGVMENNHYWMVSNSSGGGNVPRFRLKTGTTTSTLIADSGTFSVGAWAHVAATYDGSTMRLYKDGDPIGSLAKSGTIATSSSVDAWIGANPDSSNFFDGIIDEAAIYSRALSEAEIEDLMAQ